ncbi:MAG: ABC transporter permease subunit, partial [Clostridia bacterium]|nr:ABC transporter permease subunit [Clostridia bacterium]
MTLATITEKLLEGFGVSCWLFALTLLFSLPLGLIIAFGSMTRFKPLRWLCRTVVWIIRGTPLMLQLFVVFYVPGMLFDVRLFTGENGRFMAALVAFVINYA